MDDTDFDALCEGDPPAEAITKRLTQLCADLQARPWRSHWVLVILLLIATFATGYAIGQLRLR